MYWISKLSQKHFIGNKITDHIFVILSPFLALIVVFLFCEPRSRNGAFLYSTETPYLLPIIAVLMTHSHVLLGFLRSHLNKSIFVMHKFRFTVVPLLVLAFMGFLPGSVVYIGFGAHYWDEWHSIMQTFGFSRIYDAKMGNNSLTGRKLDMGMSFVVGFLPYLIMESYFPEEQRIELLAEYSYLPANFINGYFNLSRVLRWPYIIFGISYLIFYAISFRKLIKEGYIFSTTKLLLYLSTGISTIIVATFYTMADSDRFGNIYHALQYFFIVYLSERTNIAELTRIPKNNNKKLLSLYVLVILPFFIFLAALRQLPSALPIIGAFWLLTTLMHFWYDGFIWSVRRQEI